MLSSTPGTAESGHPSHGLPTLLLSKRKERERSTQAGSVSSLPAYSELYSPTSSSGPAVKGLGIREEGDLSTGGELTEEALDEPTSLAPVDGPSAVLATSPGARPFAMPPRTLSGTFTSYHLSVPRPVLPAPAAASSSSSDDSEGEESGPETQLDRLVLRSSSALATAQSLLSSTLGGRGGLLDQEERGREGEEALRRVEVETRLRMRRDDELYSTRIDPLFNSIFTSLTDLERHPSYSYASAPLRSRLNPVGASLGTVQRVEAASHHSSSSSPSGKTPSTIPNVLPSSPTGALDHSSDPPPRSPATSLLSSLHTRTSSVSSSKSFFLSPPPLSTGSPRTPTGSSAFNMPTPASSPPTQTRFPSPVARLTPTGASTAAFSSPPQPRSSHPTPTLHPSPSLDRILPTASTSAAQLSVSPSRQRTMSSTPALGGGRPSLGSLNVQPHHLPHHRPMSAASSASLTSTSIAPSEAMSAASSASLTSTSIAPSEADEDAIETLDDSLPTTPAVRHRRSHSPLPPTSFRASSSRESASPVSATTTPTMHTVSLPAEPSPVERTQSAVVGTAVLGEGSAAMRRLRTLGASPAPAEEVQKPVQAAKWGSGWFGVGS